MKALRFASRACVMAFLAAVFTTPLAAPFAYITEASQGNVRIIDTADNRTVANIDVGLSPSGIAFNPAGTRAYVTNLLADTVSVIDTGTRTVIATVPFVGQGPLGIAVSRDAAGDDRAVSPAG